MIGLKTGPKAERLDDGVKISFEVSSSSARQGSTSSARQGSTPTDVEVAILDSQGKVVRHLAAGVLGNKPPMPLQAGLSQELRWGGRDDFGKRAASGEFRCRVRAGTGFNFGRFIGADPYNFGAVDSLATDQQGNVYVGLLYWPPDAPLPDGFKMDRVWTDTVGAVVKFDPKQGGAMPGDDGAQRAEAISGALSVYPGLAPLSKAGLAGRSRLERRSRLHRRHLRTSRRTRG